MRYILLTLAFYWFAALAVFPQTADDEVMIAECNEIYEFKSVHDRIVVKNKREATYEHLRQYTKKIQPGIFYGDNITIDNSYCSRSRTPQYRSITPENVFYDDSKVCYYDVTLDRKTKNCKVKFERTFLDIRYFACVSLCEEYYVKHKTVTFIIPQGMTQFELISKNITQNIQASTKNDGKRTIITYEICDQKSVKDEENMPKLSQVYPIVFVKGAFSDLRDLFGWSRQMADVDTSIPSINEILNEIQAVSTTPFEQIKNTYAWVQKNIRYVAFEAGVSSHQPDKPSEVIRKRYGDCKGMSLLLKTLLKAQGFDARQTDIGTKQVPILVSELPALCSLNHSICTVEWEGVTYYLDPTSHYVPVGHIPSNIQGMEALVEEVDGCSLRKLPVFPVSANCDSLHISLKLSDDKALRGEAERWVKGDLKEAMLSAYYNTETQQRKAFKAQMLNNLSHSNNIVDAEWEQKDNRAEWAVLKGNVINNHSCEALQGDLYIELDPDNMLFSTQIDTTKRENDYVFDMPCQIIREVVLHMPDSYHCEQLPDPFDLRNEVAEMNCSFKQIGNEIIFRKVLTIHQPRLACNHISQWNKNLRQWNEASHEQIILKSITPKTNINEN